MITKITNLHETFLAKALTSFFLTQKSFHMDVVSVMKRWLKEEELLPEDQRPTVQSRSHYIKVSFSLLFNSTIGCTFPFFVLGDHIFFFVCVCVWQVMRRVFCWFPAHNLKNWNLFFEEFPRWVHSTKHYSMSINKSSGWPHTHTCWMYWKI